MNGLLPDIIAIGGALLAGMAARGVGLPPLVGFLGAGFLLYAFGGRVTPVLAEFAEIGVTLLLFTIGLKLRVGNLLMPQIWGVASLHMLLAVLVAGGFLFLAGAVGLAGLAGLEPATLALLAFAMSFSSTVFAIKVLEEQGETTSLFARIAIGVLIVQDIAAVVYLGVAAGKVPSAWALLLLLLLPLRPLLRQLLVWAGRGELQILYGLVLALGGAWLFESVGVKGDIGALILGTLLAGHPRVPDLARQLMGFKDLFLVGFFLSIGLSAPLSLEAVGMALLLLLLVPLKALLFFFLFLRFRLRARTAFLAALSLANFSEFGLIVMADGVRQGLLNAEWLVIMAVAVSLSFVLAAPFNAWSHQIYARWRARLQRWEGERRIPEEADIHPGEVRIIVFGMGRVGTGAYDAMREHFGDEVLGVDVDERKVARHITQGRRVIRGSATDPDFWERVHLDLAHVGLIMLTMPSLEENRTATRLLRKAGFGGKITATARFDEEVDVLEAAGVDAVYNLYAEAGAGFAETVCHHILCTLPEWQDELRPQKATGPVSTGPVGRAS